MRHAHRNKSLPFPDANRGLSVLTLFFAADYRQVFPEEPAQDRVKKSTDRKQDAIVKPNAALRDLRSRTSSENQSRKKTEAIRVTRPLDFKSRTAKHRHHRAAAVSALVLDVII